MLNRKKRRIDLHILIISELGIPIVVFEHRFPVP